MIEHTMRMPGSHPEASSCTLKRLPGRPASPRGWRASLSRRGKPSASGPGTGLAAGNQGLIWRRSGLDARLSGASGQGTVMTQWYTRPVFFVSDTELAIEFYRQKLGFSLDWNHQERGRAFVCQVSRPGCELILAQDESKAGRGRAFISLDEEQGRALRSEIDARKIEAKDSWWGMPIIEILDPDKNELFFSP